MITINNLKRNNYYTNIVYNSYNYDENYSQIFKFISHEYREPDDFPTYDYYINLSLQYNNETPHIESFNMSNIKDCKSEYLNYLKIFDKVKSL